MTAQEFGEWKAWLKAEQQHPAADRMRHAQLLAGAMNGPLQRAGGRPFAASELMPKDPWAPPPAPPPAVTNDAIQAQVALLNSRMR